MAVVFPTKGDRSALLSFMAEHQEPGNDTEAKVSTVVFESDSVERVKDSSSAILAQLETFTNFFSGGGPLTGRNVLLDHTAMTSGSIFPHVRRGCESLPASVAPHGVSAADLFAVTSPVDFFASQEDEQLLARAQLVSAKEALQQVNREHGYVWTTDIPLVKKFLGAQADNTLTLLYRMSDARVKLRPVVAGDDDASLTHGSNGTDDQNGDTESSVAALRWLLALPDDRIPSDAVKAAYARFIQAADLLISWLTTVLRMVKGEDDIPKSGTYTVPAESSSATEMSRNAGSAQASPSPSLGRDQELPEFVARAARTRTVRVRRFEIHDVQYSYDSFHEQTRYFFLPEYTQYDARVQRRLLQPAYFSALRGLLSEMSAEIARLSDVAARKEPPAPNFTPYPGAFPYDTYGPHTRRPSGATQGKELPDIVFRPPLSNFCFLRDSLRIYLSTCVNEDDTTSLLYYQHIYQDCLTQSQECARQLRTLPKPPRALGIPGPNVGTGTNQLLQQQAAPASDLPRQEGFEMLQVDHTQDSDPVSVQDRRLSGWPPTHEERGALSSAFEAYWDIRGKIYDLRRSLGKDITQKNRTHVVRLASASVSEEKSLAQEKAEARQQQISDQERRSSSFSFWGALKSSVEALGDAVTCKAEYNPTAYGRGPTDGGNDKCDDEGFPIVASSPFSTEKQLLQAQVQRLWSVMEAQGIQLEATYKGVFFRGEKEKWADRMGKLVRKAEGMSVVFGAGGP